MTSTNLLTTSVPPFIFSYNRHNESNLNLGFLKAAYAEDRVRANFALMAGTYANANLAAEPGVIKNIFEANAGVKLSKVSRQMRYFHDFYGIFQMTPKFGITAGFDIGAEQKAKGSSDYNVWWSPVLIARYTPNNRIAVGARAEYYDDENGVIIATRTPNGFKTVGYSVNLDYKVKENVLWRIEGRGFQSKDDIFTTDDETSSQNHVLTTALALSF